MTDPRIAQWIVDLVDTRVEQILKSRPYSAYGVIDTVNTTTKTASVFLAGDSTASPGFRYALGFEPKPGALVRVWIDPRGDRWVDQSVDTILELLSSDTLTADAVILGGDLDLARAAAGVLSVDGIRVDRPACIEVEMVSAAQTITNATPTTVKFDTIRREDDEAGALSYSTSTGLFTIATAGWYLLEAGFRWANNATGVRHMLFKRNATTMGRLSQASTGITYQNGSRLLHCSASDTISIEAEQDSGSSVSMTAFEHTHATVHQIRVD